MTRLTVHLCDGDIELERKHSSEHHRENKQKKLVPVEESVGANEQNDLCLQSVPLA